jgi:hypothetical protein
MLLSGLNDVAPILSLWTYLLSKMPLMPDLALDLRAVKLGLVPHRLDWHYGELQYIPAHAAYPTCAGGWLIARI